MQAKSLDEVLAQLTSLMRLPTDRLDDYLITMAPLLISFAEEECETTWTTEEGFYQLPSGVTLFLAKALEFYANPTGISSESFGEDSVSYDTGALPQSVTSLLDRYKTTGANRRKRKVTFIPCDVSR